MFTIPHVTSVLCDDQSPATQLADSKESAGKRILHIDHASSRGTFNFTHFNFQMPRTVVKRWYRTDPRSDLGAGPTAVPTDHQEDARGSDVSFLCQRDPSSNVSRTQLFGFQAEFSEQCWWDPPCSQCTRCAKSLGRIRRIRAFISHQPECFQFHLPTSTGLPLVKTNVFFLLPGCCQRYLNSLVQGHGFPFQVIVNRILLSEG